MKKRLLVGLSVLVTLSMLLTGCQTGRVEHVAFSDDGWVVAFTQEDSGRIYVADRVGVQAEDMDVDMNVVVELWEQRPGKLRAEVLEASEADIVGVVSVTDGEQAWLYHPGEDVVVIKQGVHATVKDVGRSGIGRDPRRSPAGDRALGGGHPVGDG